MPRKVKFGITGFSQVRGWRGESDTKEKIIRRVECDLYYMEHRPLFFDIEILFARLWPLPPWKECLVATNDFSRRSPF